MLAEGTLASLDRPGPGAKPLGIVIGPVLRREHMRADGGRRWWLRSRDVRGPARRNSSHSIGPHPRANGDCDRRGGVRSRPGSTDGHRPPRTGGARRRPPQWRALRAAGSGVPGMPVGLTPRPQPRQLSPPAHDQATNDSADRASGRGPASGPTRAAAHGGPRRRARIPGRGTRRCLGSADWPGPGAVAPAHRTRLQTPCRPTLQWKPQRPDRPPLPDGSGDRGRRARRHLAQPHGRLAGALGRGAPRDPGREGAGGGRALRGPARALDRRRSTPSSARTPCA